MAGRRTQFTADFRIEEVRLLGSGRPVSAVARELRVGANTPRLRRRQCAIAAGSAPSTIAVARDAFLGNGGS